MNNILQSFLADIQKVVASVRLLSPHPDPLPWGEGMAGGGLLLSNVCVVNTSARLLMRRRRILPLPGGEGRGEGEKKPTIICGHLFMNGKASHE